VSPDVFISYASEDREIGLSICNGLEDEGISCWIAPRDILPGMVYAEAIIKGIDSAKVLVLVFSSHANASPHIIREVERAVHNNAIIIPVKLEKIDPSPALQYYISAPQWIDATKDPYEFPIELLVRAVRAHIPDVPEKTITDNNTTTVSAPHTSASALKHVGNPKMRKNRIIVALVILTLLCVTGLSIYIVLINPPSGPQAFIIGEPTNSGVSIIQYYDLVLQTSILNASIIQNDTVPNEFTITKAPPKFEFSNTSGIPEITLVSSEPFEFDIPIIFLLPTRNVSFKSTCTGDHGYLAVRTLGEKDEYGKPFLNPDGYTLVTNVEALNNFNETTDIFLVSFFDTKFYKNHTSSNSIVLTSNGEIGSNIAYIDPGGIRLRTLIGWIGTGDRKYICNYVVSSKDPPWTNTTTIFLIHKDA